MADAALAERLWTGTGGGWRAARAALTPLSWAFGAVVRARNEGYARGWIRSESLALPAVSVGNLTVGGTGKTPVAAWVAGELARRGGRPAIVLRGYGADEPLVHARLNPAIPVLVAPDRVAGARAAAVQGADIVVLDDAFQHRRARRDADLVLVSADRWPDGQRLLPAGPWREPLVSLARATLAIVTRKAAPLHAAEAVAGMLRDAVPSLRVAIAHLAPGALQRLDGAGDETLERLAGARVHAIAAIGDSRAFLAQLTEAGAHVTPSTFVDHHPFSPADIAQLVARSARADIVVCTLKDAVKLQPRWPASAPALWYVSQRVALERGQDELERVLGDVLQRCAPHDRTAGTGRPHSPTHGL